MEYAVRLDNITKRFYNVVANDDVSLCIKKGEIHGLIGENGAGKSTIMNILYGLYQPDEGEIELFGKKCTIHSPHDAILNGIGMVHQHFMQMPGETVLNNIMLGAAPRKGIFIDKEKAQKDITALMELYGLKVPLSAKIYELSVGQKQRVEILKALYRKAKILILDEPTAVLTPMETDGLLEIMKKLKEQGCTIIFITHKLKEVLRATDCVTVMRRGRVTGAGDTPDMTVEKLSELIVGRSVQSEVSMAEYKPGGDVLEMRGVCSASSGRKVPLKDISINVKSGEIVGIAGVEGNGQTELVEAIAGMLPITNGTISLKGEELRRKNIRQRRQKGIGHVPEDRLKTGTSKECTIGENLILNRYYQQPYSRFGVLNNKKLREFSETLVDEFGIKTPDSTHELRTLSGGNMQKVVFAREIETYPELLIAAQPTRGVDIGAIEYIYQRIAALRDSGRSVLLVSAELDEIIDLSDRIYVMYEGEIVAELKRGEADEYEMSEYMLGAKRQNAEKEGA